MNLEQFLENAGNHTLNIVRDDGLYRHLSFTNNGSTIYRFDLVTWPGKLCITGNCGTYVFTRTPDMFEFFRTPTNEPLFINPDYWGEKLDSICKQGGYRAYSRERFKDILKDDFESQAEDYSDAEKQQIWSEIENKILSKDDDLEAALEAASGFKSHGISFEDLWDNSFDEPTVHYLWCLWAIVWGIRQYDEITTKTSVTGELSN